MTKYSIRNGKALKVISMIAIIAFAIWFAFIGRHFRYLENLPDGEQLAMELIAKGRPASDCNLTYQIIPSFPSLSEARAYCIFEYAKISQNSSVCDLLMPSDYGMRCLAEVNTEHGKINNEPTCYKENGNLKCVDAETGKVLTDTPYNQIANCSKYTKGKIRDICYNERSSTIPDVDDCYLIEDNRMKMYCMVSIALKKKEPALCEKISDEWAIKNCKLTISLWQKYPQYRCDLISGPECP